MSAQTEGLQRAISAVTLWNEHDVGALAAHVDRLVVEDAEAGRHGLLLVGLTNLAGLLAHALADTTGRTFAEVLETFATAVERLDE